MKRLAEQDASAIAAIERLWSSEPWSEDALSDFAGSAGALVLTEHNENELIGYLCFRHAADFGEIVTLGVHPDHRRLGVARRLMAALFAECTALGVTALSLEVRTSNTAARALYEAFGFASVGVRRAFYKQPTEDALVYSIPTQKETEH